MRGGTRFSAPPRTGLGRTANGDIFVVCLVVELLGFLYLLYFFI